MTETAPEAPNAEYHSQIDPAFSRVFNEVFGEEDSEKTGSDPAPTPAPGEGTPAPAAPVVPAGQQPPATDPATGGEAAPATAEPEKPGAVPGGEGGAQGAPAGEPAGVPVNPWGGVDRAYAEIAPLFDTAAAKLLETGEQALREQALEDINNGLAPEVLESIRAHPFQLVGDTVPAVKGEGTIVLKTLQEAEAWQGAVKHIIGGQVDARTAALMQDAQPVLSTLQASVTLFRANQDLVPGTKEYNPALAQRFIKMARPYLHEVDGKPIGFRVDVQPLVDAIREELGTAPAPAPAPAPTARQEQVAGQRRNEAGQFDAPQAGIPSTAGISGEPEEDFGTFWKAVNHSEMNI